MPATLVSANCEVTVTSFSPPTTKTVPGSYTASASYLSAKSAKVD